MDFNVLIASFASGLIVSAIWIVPAKLSVYRYIDGGDGSVLIVSAAVHVELGQKLSVSAEDIALGEPGMDALCRKSLRARAGLFEVTRS